MTTALSSVNTKYSAGSIEISNKKQSCASSQCSAAVHESYEALKSGNQDLVLRYDRPFLKQSQGASMSFAQYEWTL